MTNLSNSSQELKVCTCCKIAKPTSGFNKRKSKSGLTSWCRDCINKLKRDKMNIYEANRKKPISNYPKRSRSKKNIEVVSLMEGEYWKDIPGLGGLYQASNMGRIRSLDREIKYDYRTRLFKGKILTPNQNRDGYMQIAMCINRKTKAFAVHRLVALTFLPKPDNKKEVNHINLNKLDNTIENLEWVTHKENIAHAILNGKHGSLRRKAA
jgi:hypothetical protein